MHKAVATLRWILWVAIVAGSVSSGHAREILLPLNDQEQVALRELLDVATKAGGLNVAPATVHFAQKLLAAQTASPQTPSEEPKK